MSRLLGTCFAGLLLIGGLLSDAQEPNWVLKLPASSPTPRASAAMAYDAPRGQVVLFGGYGGSYSNETWVWDGANWMQKNPTISPTPRRYHSMVYDAARGQVVLFGGYDGSNRNDTWVWDGTNWTQKNPATSPTSRGYHSMAYDAARGQVVLFGGYDGSYRNDTWVWDGTNWTQKTPANSPTHGVSSAIVYDAARGQVVLFGGYDGTQYGGATWVWDGTNWIQRVPANSPPARASHAMAYDVTVGRVVLFGGYGDGGSSYRNDTWVWDGVSWAQKNPTNSPTPRINPSLSYDERRGQVVLFGGDDSGGGSVYRNDTWLWAVSAVPYSITDAGQVSGLRFTYPSPGQNVFICVYFSGLSSWGVPVSHLLVGGSTASADTQGYMDFNALMEQYVWTANTNGTYVVGAYETPASCSSDTAAVGYAAFYRTADNNNYGTVGHWSVLPVSTGASASISVTTNLATASFTITGPANYSGSGPSFTQTNAPAGSYTITYGAVTGYTTPASETKTLAAGGTISFAGNYVVSAPSLSISPSSLSFTYKQGVAGPPAGKSIAVSTPSPLPFSATVTTTNGGNWLSVSPTSGTTPASLLVNVATGLAAGQYSGAINISSAGVSNNPVTVPVVLNVSPADGTLTVSLNISNGGFNVLLGSNVVATGQGATSALPLNPGTYTVNFIEVPGYFTPATQTAIVPSASKVDVQAAYQRLLIVSFTGFDNAPEKSKCISINPFDLLTPGSGVEYTTPISGGPGMTQIIPEIQGTLGYDGNSALKGGSSGRAFTFYGHTSDGSPPNIDACTPPDSAKSKIDHWDAEQWVKGANPTTWDKLAVVGHSYGGYRAYRFVEQVRRKLSITADLLITVDPVDWTKCSIIDPLNKVLNGDFSKAMKYAEANCDQHNQPPNLSPSGALAEFSFYQTKGIYKIPLTGFTLSSSGGVVGYSDVAHDEIDDDRRVHAKILELFLERMNLPNIVLLPGTPNRVTDVISVPLRISATGLSPSAGIELISATLNGMSATNFAIVRGIGEIGYGGSRQILLSFPGSAVKIGRHGTLEVQGRFNSGQTFKLEPTLLCADGRC